MVEGFNWLPGQWHVVKGFFMPLLAQITVTRCCWHIVEHFESRGAGQLAAIKLETVVCGGISFWQF